MIKNLLPHYLSLLRIRYENDSLKIYVVKLAVQTFEGIDLIDALGFDGQFSL